MELNKTDTSLNKIYIKLQLVINFIFIIFMLIEKKNVEYFGVVIFISALLWGILQLRVNRITSLYLKDNNKVIYNKYMGWRFILTKKYGTLALINGCKLNDNDFNEITDKRIVQLLKESCVSRKILLISSMFIVLLAIVMSLF